jgi:putative metallohydrolase (TIGR04338 family)
MARDYQRSAVYAAEELWGLRLDAARRGARRAVVAGSTLTLPREVRFGTLRAAQDYADHHLALAAGVGYDGSDVRLRERRGQSAAHWKEPDEIALPVPRYGDPWALRESVLLHEVAHHLVFHTRTLRVSGSAHHGPSYVATMLALVEQAMGPEAAFALRVDYEEHGVVT